jgi:predicted dehydrogenase
MNSKLRFGIVGTGMIADIVANAIKGGAESGLVAVASRRRETADEFAMKHNVPRVFGSWEELVSWDGVDAVYVATPTAVREEVCVAAANNHKHVLAEKPFASLRSLRFITSVCRANDVAFMDATHFVHHPRTRKLKQELEERIGRVQVVRTCFFTPFMDRSNIRFNPEKEPTGVIGDMAWYSMRAITEFMASDEDLTRVCGFAQRDDATGAVIRGSGLLVFSDGRTSNWDVGYNSGAHMMDLDLLGQRGMISLDDFVLDWAGGGEFDDPDYPVGFIQRSGMMKPGEFERVATPSSQRATLLMIQDFVALTRNPAGQPGDTSINISEQTQGLLDAVWTQLKH